MGMDMHVRLAKYDEKSNLYKELVLYKPGEEYHYDEEGNKIVDNPVFEKVHIYNGRDYEMFDGMKDGDNSDGYGNFPWINVQLNSLDKNLAEHIDYLQHQFGYFDFRELSLADMKVYLNDHPTVVDYEADEWENWKVGDPKPQKVNPIKYLYEDICNYAKFADDWSWDYVPLSHYKVIFYFDD